MGRMGLLPLRRKECWGFIRPEKSNGFGSVWTRELGYQTPPKPLTITIVKEQLTEFWSHLELRAYTLWFLRVLLLVCPQYFKVNQRGISKWTFWKVSSPPLCLLLRQSNLFWRRIVFQYLETDYDFLKILKKSLILRFKFINTLKFLWLNTENVA